MQIGADAMENGMAGNQKIKNRTALWPSNSTSGYIAEETQNTNLKEYMKEVYCRIIYNSQNMEATQAPINRQVDKTVMVHTHDGILLSHKKVES